MVYCSRYVLFDSPDISLGNYCKQSLISKQVCSMSSEDVVVPLVKVCQQWMKPSWSLNWNIIEFNLYVGILCHICWWLIRTWYFDYFASLFKNTDRVYSTQKLQCHKFAAVCGKMKSSAFYEVVQPQFSGEVGNSSISTCQVVSRSVQPIRHITSWQTHRHTHSPTSASWQ